MNANEHFHKLRFEAEKILQDRKDTTVSQSKARLDKLIEELNIHQIELELQNEELKQTQLRLEDSLQKFSDFYNISPISYFTLRTDGSIAEVNATGSRLLHSIPQQLIKKRFSDFVFPDYQDDLHLHIRHVMETGKKHTCELRIKKMTGIALFIRMDSILVTDKNGETLIRSAVTDITEQQKTKQQLIELNADLENRVNVRTLELKEKLIENEKTKKIIATSEEKFRAIFNNTLQTFILLDKKYRIQLFNQKAYETLRGALKGELRNNISLREALDVEIITRFKPLVDKAFEGESVITEHKGILPQNRTKWYEFRFTPVKNDTEIDGIFINIQDITEHKRTNEVIKNQRDIIEKAYQKLHTAHEELQLTNEKLSTTNILYEDANQQITESEHIYRTLVQNLPGICVLLFNKQFYFIRVGGNQIDNFDNIARLEGEHLNKLKDDTLVDVFKPMWRTAIKGKATSIEFEYDGAYYFMQTIPVFTSAKIIFGGLCMLQNITERKLAEIEIIRGKNFVDSIIENLPIGVQVFDKDGVSVRMNKKQVQLLGLPGTDYGVGKFNVLTDPFSVKIGASKKYKKVYADKVLLSWEYDVTFDVKDNQWETVKQRRYFLESAFPILDENNELYYVVALLQDFTKRRTAELAIAENRKRLDAILQNMIVGIQEVDSCGNIVYTNPAAVSILNMAKDEICKRNFRDSVWRYIDRNYKPVAVDKLPLSLALNEKRVVKNAEIGLVQSNHSIKWLLVNAAPMYNASGVLYGAIANFDDITTRIESQRRMQESENKFRSFIEQSTDSILILDNEGSVIEWNKAAINYTGLSTEDVIGEKVWDIDYRFIPPERKTPEVLERIKNTVKQFIAQDENENRVHTMEGEIRNIHGEAIYMSVSVFPIKTDKGLIFGRIARNITDRIKTERALKESEEKLRELNATKDKFFSIIAHDLKNPFNSLIGLNEVLISNIESYDKDRIKELLEVIYLSAQKAYKLVENLLEWSRAQTGRIRFSPRQLMLKGLAVEALDGDVTGASKKEIEFYHDVNAECTAYADYYMVTTILRNLVSNAVKFTKPRGRVGIVCEIIQIDNTQFVEIMVEDSGVGISEENQKKLFRIDSGHSSLGTDNEKGTGLGLILSKEFVEKCGGTIRVESQLGKGSRFIFTLPKQQTNKTAT